MAVIRSKEGKIDVIQDTENEFAFTYICNICNANWTSNFKYVIEYTNPKLKRWAISGVILLCGDCVLDAHSGKKTKLI